MTLNYKCLRETAVVKAVSLLYVPYIWGGDSPTPGMDCSGFLGYILRGIGLLPPDFDATADMYSEMFAEMAVPEPYMGCAAFYGRTPTHITHTMLILSEKACIGAVRGGSWCRTVEDARRNDAKIDIMPIKYRNDLRLIADPFKLLEEKWKV